MKNVVILNESRPITTPLQAGYCVSFLCKLRGLTFRRNIPEDWGLLLVQSKDSIIDSSIHMFFMFFDLGIVWINDSGEVVDRCIAKRWLTIKAPKNPARYILEIYPERFDEFHIGDKIRFEEQTN